MVTIQTLKVRLTLEKKLAHMAVREQAGETKHLSPTQQKQK